MEIRLLPYIRKWKFVYSRIFVNGNLFTSVYSYMETRLPPYIRKWKFVYPRIFVNGNSFTPVYSSMKTRLLPYFCQGDDRLLPFCCKRNVEWFYLPYLKVNGDQWKWIPENKQENICQFTLLCLVNRTWDMCGIRKQDTFLSGETIKHH